MVGGAPHGLQTQTRKEGAPEAQAGRRPPHGQHLRLGDYAPRRGDAGRPGDPLREAGHERPPHAAGRGLRVVIGGAGGAAHLAGLVAALTPIPVLGVPMESASLKGMDSLLSIVQMPGGIPVATFAIGKPGAVNAALFAAAILAHGDPAVRRALSAYRAAQTSKVLRARLP